MERTERKRDCASEMDKITKILKFGRKSETRCNRFCAVPFRVRIFRTFAHLSWRPCLL